MTMLNYFIRQLTREDEALLWEMLYHALYVPQGGEPFPKDIVNEPVIVRYVLNWGKADDQGFAAVDQRSQKPVGAVWIRLFTSENKGYGYVGDDIPELSIALLPEYRGQGIGTELLTRLVENIRSQYRALSLSVSADNPARRLYLRLGFEIVEENRNSLTMMKML
jgi:ribosomal protein S18 acetylase RimI-like enzyme